MTIRVDKTTVIWTGAVLAVTAGFLTLVTRPQMRRLAEVERQIRADRSAVEEQQQRAQLAKELEGEVAQASAQVADLETRLPQQEMLGTFLEQLARFTEAHKLRPDEIQPGQPVRSAKAVALPIVFRVRGPFPAIYGLMQDIERLPRLTQIESFEAKTVPDDPGTAQAEVSLKIFFQAL